jgi:hypothetical protein
MQSTEVRISVKQSQSESNIFFLERLFEPEVNELLVLLVEASSAGQQEEIIAGTGIRATPVIPIEGASPIELYWDSYIAYAVRNESYAKDSGTNVASSGILIEKSASPFLTFVSNSTCATSEYPGPFKHWQVNCADHVIDVISTSEPVIRKNLGEGADGSTGEIKALPDSCRVVYPD